MEDVTPDAPSLIKLLLSAEESRRSGSDVYIGLQNRFLQEEPVRGNKAVKQNNVAFCRDTVINMVPCSFKQHWNILWTSSLTFHVTWKSDVTPGSLHSPVVVEGGLFKGPLC